MPDFLQLVSTLREQMNATLSRSDVLKPLAWLIGLLIAALALMAYGKVPDWLLTWIGICLLVCVAIYIGAYLFCLIIDRDALRSEKYSLHKMAIEHGIYGDSDTGVVSPPAPVSLPAPPDVQKRETGAGDA